MTEPAMESTASPDPSRPCPSCGREWGPGIACQFCHQVEGLPTGVQLSSAGRRLGAYLLDLVLAIVTLFIGWFIWLLIVWARGQTPGKQVLGMRVVRLREGRKAGWGLMFVRDFLLKGLLFGTIIVTVTLGLGLILNFWLLWDKKNQELWDKLANTIVVDDPNKALA
jgi:uncharacterized RDD family membrane protein YckC